MQYGRDQIRSCPACSRAEPASPRLGASAEPYQLERRRAKYDIRDWSPDGTRMGKGISLSHDELAILKGILEDMEL